LSSSRSHGKHHFVGLDETDIRFSVDEPDILELVEKRTEFIRYLVGKLYVGVDYWHILELVRASHPSHLARGWVCASLRYVFGHCFCYRAFFPGFVVHPEIHESIVYGDYDDEVLFVARDV